MGNAVFTTSELDYGDERSVRNSPGMGKTFPTPLELISKPLVAGKAVPGQSDWKGLNLDPLAVKRDPVSSVISFVLHVAIFALILWFALRVHKQIVAPPQVHITPVEFKPYIPVTLPAPKTMGGGGGGGAQQVVEANKGRLPPVVKTQIAPVEVLKVDHPKLAAAPAVVMPQPVKIPVNSSMPNFGVTQSPQVALVSQGGGTGAGFGRGAGGGIGSGRGAGVGPGSVGGYGGGIMTVGGGVSAPQVLHKVEPEFSDAARQAKYQGVVSIQLIVDPRGNPVNIRVIRHLGMGLDEKAMDAVRQYRFKPAMYQGHPVPVQMVIDVDFHMD
jgi:periplasmic protein TonB